MLNSLVVMIGIFSLASRALSRVSASSDRRITQTTELGYLSLSMSPTQMANMNGGEVQFYCCPISCDGSVPHSKNLKLSFQNPENPPFAPARQKARFQMFQVYANKSHTYNQKENVVNYCNNTQGGYHYRSETTIAFVPNMFPINSQICMAVESANGGRFSFLIQQTNESVSDVWRRGNTTVMKGDPSNGPPLPMRQFLQFVPHVHTIPNTDEITFKTRFCTSKKKWRATLRVSAMTPLSAFYSYACDPQNPCGYDTSRNWVSSDRSGTSYNEVVVTQNNVSNPIPDIKWAVYGYGANLNRINNFSLYVQFKG